MLFESEVSNVDTVEKEKLSVTAAVAFNKSEKTAISITGEITR